MWTGGCACGTVRYRLNSPPTDAGWCHCRICQLNSGSPAMAFATVAYADFEVSQGEMKRFASSDFGWRMFCGVCGTPLGMHIEPEPDTIDFSIATLDHPDRVVPEYHIFYASRICWAEAADTLPRFDGTRPVKTRA